jgi:hypothetical protein
MAIPVTFLDIRHQCGPKYTTSLEVEMWGLWLVLDCLDDEAVAALDFDDGPGTYGAVFPESL